MSTWHITIESISGLIESGKIEIFFDPAGPLPI